MNQKFTGKVNEANPSADVIDPAEALKTADFSVPRIRQNSGLTYKFVLVSHDLLVVLLALGLILRLEPHWFEAGGGWLQVAATYFICLLTVAFYPTQNLYNYHLIYSRRYHLLGQLKAAGLSLLTLLMIAGFFLGAAVLSGALLIPLLVSFALFAVLAGRYFQESILNVVRAMGLGLLVIGLAGLVSKDDTPLLFASGVGIAAGFAAASAVMPVSRFILVHIVFSTWMKRRFRRQVLIIGSNDEARSIGKHIIETDAPFWLVGAIGTADAEVFLDIGIEKCFLGSLNKLPEVVETDQVSEIIITDELISKRTLVHLLDYCTTQGVNAWFSPKLMPIIDVKLYIDNFCGRSLIRLGSQKNSWLFNKVKHALDALMTLPGFVALLPLFLSIAAAIRLDSKGPVFYRARAIGKDGQRFDMYKFRSMQADTDPGLHKTYVSKLIKGQIGRHTNGGEPLKITEDPRVTRVGKMLRKTSLDELPQLINVLKGEMSLVGPRPCLPYEYELYQDWYKKRTVVRPGITGLWQVAGRSEVSFEDMILLDLYYIYNRSVMMDFSILWETIFAVMAKKGAY